MPTVKSSEGLELAYEVRGDGPLGIIFQHGWASVGEHWKLVLENLPLKGRKYVTLDLAGHGASKDAPDAHSIEAYARQLLSVADDVGLARFVTVGHSMGAKFTQYLRIIAPERLLGQVAIAPTPAGFVGEEASDEVIEQYSAQAGDSVAMAKLFRQLVSAPVSDEIVTTWAENAARIPRSVLAASMRAFARTDFERELLAASSAPPTLVIGGAKDFIYTPDVLAERVPRETPRATLRILDSGHDVPNERPYETALLIDGFLAAMRGAD